SGGGAGIQADLKTFAALGVHGTSAITAITAQNTVTVTAIQELPVKLIRAQIDAVVGDLAPAAAKTGMLSSPEIIGCVAGADGDQAVDVLFDDDELVELTAGRLHTPNTHGSGCTFSAAIAAHLALGHSTRQAVEMAKVFITAAIRSGLAIGHGHGPVNPMFDV